MCLRCQDSLKILAASSMDNRKFPKSKLVRNVPIVLLVMVIIWGLVSRNGIRAAIANNFWSVSFVKANLADTLTPQQLLTAPKTHPHAKLLQARSAMESGEYQAALQLLEPFSPTSDPVVLGTQAELLFTVERYPEALEIWRKLGQYGNIEHAARILTSQNDLDMEILAWQKANEIRPDIYTPILIYAQLTKANSFREAGNYSEAISQYLAISNQFPQNEMPYSELAWAYWIQGQTDLAVATMDKAIDIPSSNVQFYMRAGGIFEQAGYLEKALYAYQKVLQIDPQRKDALQAVERITKP